MSGLTNIERTLLRHQSKSFSVLFILAFLALSALIVLRVGDGKYFLEHEDEAIYYCSAKLFAQTNSVQAEGCNEEDVAPIGKINWYGPGFHVVYGTIFKIFGESATAFPWFHFFLVITILFLFFRLPLPLSERITICLALIISEQFFAYIFTFYPETLMLLFASVLTLQLYFLSNEPDQAKARKLGWLFIAACLVFSVFRITFIFWLVGWVTLGRGSKVIAFRALIFLGFILLSFVYMKFFLAPTFSESVKKIDLLQSGNIVDFLTGTFTAMKNNVKGIFLAKSITVIVFIGMAAIAFWLRRERFVLASLLISLTLLGVLLAYYTVYPHFFIKQTAMLIPLLITSIVVGSGSVLLQYGMIVFLLAIVPNRIKHTLKIVDDRRLAYLNYVEFKALREAFSDIPDHIRGESSIILWCYNEYDYGRSAGALLSFSTIAGNPILYTTNVVDPATAPEVKFQLLNKLDVNYILSRHELQWPTLKQIHSTQFYTLYEIVSRP